MNADSMADALLDAAAAARRAVQAVDRTALRTAGGRPTQYAVDIVAEEAILKILSRLKCDVLSEERGWVRTNGASMTIVLDPIDGTDNCVRGIPYWSTSLCAVDGDGPWVGVVVNQATGHETIATRGRGVIRDGLPAAPAGDVTLENAVVSLCGPPGAIVPWRQIRSLGSAALELADVACGVLDGFVDNLARHAPWDYLAGVLACEVAGAIVHDVHGRSLTVANEEARRQIVAAANPTLAEALASSAARPPLPSQS